MKSLQQFLPKYTIALAIVINIFKIFKSVDVSSIDTMKE